MGDESLFDHQFLLILCFFLHLMHAKISALLNKIIYVLLLFNNTILFDHNNPFNDTR